MQYCKGIAAELQLRKAQGAAAQLCGTVPALQNELDIAMNALDVLLGLQPGATLSQPTVPAAIPAPPAVSAADGPAALLRRRPDVIATERTLAAASRGAVASFRVLGGGRDPADGSAATADTGIARAGRLR